MMLNISILATELLVEKRRIACTTLLQEALELLSHLWVEDIACLFKSCKRICIQHRCPSIAIITRSITCGEDVVVECRTIASDDLWDHLHILH